MAAFIDPSLFPETLHPRLSALSGLYERQQWHQLTGELLALIKDPQAQVGDSLLQVSASASLPLPSAPPVCSKVCPPPPAHSLHAHPPPSSLAVPHLYLYL